VTVAGRHRDCGGPIETRSPCSPNSDAALPPRRGGAQEAFNAGILIRFLPPTLIPRSGATYMVTGYV
jgi:hypothetical protein